MRYWVLLYYLLFLVNVSYRDFSFEYKMYASVSAYFNETIYFFLYSVQIILALTAAAICIFTEKKQLHLLFFSILFIIDLYIQNAVKFESSAILVQLVPLFIYLIMHIKNREVIHLLIAAYLCIGFTVSAIGKIEGGWLNFSDLIIYKYYTQFNSVSENTIIPLDFVRTYFHPALRKGLDYLVIFFQLSAVLLLLSKKYMKQFLLLEVLFHLMVAVLLQVSLFYPYIIFYGIILAYEAGENMYTKPIRADYLYRGLTVAIATIIAYIYHSAMLPGLTFTFFKHKDFCLTVGCALLFLFYWIKYALREK